jgi:hypothetical protein
MHFLITPKDMDIPSQISDLADPARCMRAVKYGNEE